jgi:hypothetical protein
VIETCPGALPVLSSTCTIVFPIVLLLTAPDSVHLPQHSITPEETLFGISGPTRAGARDDSWNSPRFNKRNSNMTNRNLSQHKVHNRDICQGSGGNPRFFPRKFFFCRPPGIVEPQFLSGYSRESNGVRTALEPETSHCAFAKSIFR